MKKSIVMGLGLALSLAGVAGAQQPGPDTARPKHEQGTRGMRDGRRGGPDGFLLKGITLTEGQRTQIAQLRKTQRDSLAPRRERSRQDFEAMRAMREQHVASVRNLLTAEQRVQFDKNVAELKQREAERGQRGEGKRRPKPGRGV